MKNLLSFILWPFQKLFRDKPEEPKEENLPQESVYRVPAEKHESEPAPPQLAEPTPSAEKGFPSLQNKGFFPSLSSGFPSLTPEVEQAKHVIVESPERPPFPTKITRSNDYSPCKNLSTKPTIKVGKVSREDALRMAHLPLTNDMAEVGDDTVHVPILGGKTLEITPSFLVSEDQLKRENEAKLVLEKIIEEKIVEYEKLASEEEKPKEEEK